MKTPIPVVDQPANSPVPVPLPLWWVLEKQGDVVQCRVDHTAATPLICIELASQDWPLSIIERCEPKDLETSIETWRTSFLERGWTEPFAAPPSTT